MSISIVDDGIVEAQQETFLFKVASILPRVTVGGQDTIIVSITDNDGLFIIDKNCLILFGCRIRLISVMQNFKDFSDNLITNNKHLLCTSFYLLWSIFFITDIEVFFNQSTYVTVEESDVVVITINSRGITNIPLNALVTTVDGTATGIYANIIW